MRCLTVAGEDREGAESQCSNRAPDNSIAAQVRGRERQQKEEQV